MGFSLIELLVVIAIIGILATAIVVSLGTATKKARDVKRKADLSQIGRMLSVSVCYLPDAGPGDYDILTLVGELVAKNPQFVNYAFQVPKDPKSGNNSEAFYRYVVSAAGAHCALYANLEKDDEPVTLPGLTAPTPGGGTGVLQALAAGWNGTDKYFQVGR